MAQGNCSASRVAFSTHDAEPLGLIAWMVFEVNRAVKVPSYGFFRFNRSGPFFALCAKARTGTTSTAKPVMASHPYAKMIRRWYICAQEFESNVFIQIRKKPSVFSKEIQ
uniref:Uncharacterized protein n=1 Tax=Oryza sativa subsp. japonica TaxID=39947 RepID=Q8H587_ORYSJ|nr:hypothetical protein [Oryza sativa Japonica Group]BAD30790.1 hypothetical protein [Oryza sativa Japonica Group]